jgi:hypothetical protein
MNHLMRALSMHSVAFHTYGDEMATNLVRDFSRSLGLTADLESSGSEHGMLTESVMSLKKLLRDRSR